MIRTVLHVSRLIIDSPGLMLLGLVVVALPGGLLLMPMMASKVRRAKAANSAQRSAFAQPRTASNTYFLASPSAKSGYVSDAPSSGKLL